MKTDEVALNASVKWKDDHLSILGQNQIVRCGVKMSFHLKTIQPIQKQSGPFKGWKDWTMWGFSKSLPI